MKERCIIRLESFRYACDELSQVPELLRAKNRRVLASLSVGPPFGTVLGISTKVFLNAAPSAELELRTEEPGNEVQDYRSITPEYGRVRLVR